MQSAVFLDRDGVVNEAIIEFGKPRPPRNIGELRILKGVKNSVEMLAQNGFQVVVVTNQPDIARGTTETKTVDSFHELISAQTGIKHFYICSHDDADMCECRKPKVGLLEMASKDLGIDLKSSFLVGDRWRDIAAAQVAGCRAFFIDYSYDEKQPDHPFERVASLLEAVEIIVKSRGGDEA